MVEYRDIPGFPGYRAGDDGSVWSCLEPLRIKGVKGVKYEISNNWRRLSQFANTQGYLKVSLRRDGRAFNRFVHRLVLETFVGPCPAGMAGCHNPDPNPKNNRLVNLRWDTYRANTLDCVRSGRHGSGGTGGGGRLISAGDVQDILRRLNAGEFQRVVGADYGIPQPFISRIKRGKFVPDLP